MKITCRNTTVCKQEGKALAIHRFPDIYHDKFVLTSLTRKSWEYWDYFFTSRKRLNVDGGKTAVCTTRAIVLYESYEMYQQLNKGTSIYPHNV